MISEEHATSIADTRDGMSCCESLLSGRPTLPDLEQAHTIMTAGAITLEREIARLKREKMNAQREADVG